MFTILLLFAAGVALVGLLALVVRTLLNRTPNLESRREAILELNHRPKRIEAGEAELSAATAEAAKITGLKTSQEEVAVAYVQLDEPLATRWLYAAVACLLGLGEAALFLLLTAPSNLLSITAGAWAFLAPLIATAWILMLHVLLSAALTDKHRPARTLRRARIGTLSFGVSVVIATWLVLSGRNLSDPLLIAQITGVGLLLLVSLTAIASAFCFLTATTLFEADHSTRELDRLERLGEAYQHHIDLVERDLDRMRNPGDGPPPPAASNAETADRRPAPHAGMVAMGLAGLVLCSASSSARAQVFTSPIFSSPSALAAPAEGSSTSVFHRSGGCDVAVDVTSSTDSLALTTTLTGVARDLPLIIDALHCQVLRIVPFAGTLFLAIEEIQLPGPRFPTTGCPAANPDIESAHVKAISILYPKVASAREQKAAEACAASQHTAEAAAYSERMKVIMHAADRLLATATLAPRGPCTALLQVVDRALLRSHGVVVITDGWPTCNAPLALKTGPQGAPGLDDPSCLIFLLIPTAQSGGVDGANDLLARLSSLGRFYPGALTLFAPEATRSFWRQLTCGRLPVQ